MVFTTFMWILYIRLHKHIMNSRHSCVKSPWFRHISTKMNPPSILFWTGPAHTNTHKHFSESKNSVKLEIFLTILRTERKKTNLHRKPKNRGNCGRYLHASMSSNLSRPTKIRIVLGLFSALFFAKRLLKCIFIFPIPFYFALRFIFLAFYF